MISGIIRQQTPDEEKDFESIWDRKKDPVAETVCRMMEKFNIKNRKELTVSDDPTKVKISCWKCWNEEFREGENSDDFSVEFENYKNRLGLIKIKKVISSRDSSIEHRHRFEYAFAYRCPYCNIRTTIMIPTERFNEKATEKIMQNIEIQDLEE